MVIWNAEKKTIAQNEWWQQQFTENEAEEDKRKRWMDVVQAAVDLLAINSKLMAYSNLLQ